MIERATATIDLHAFRENVRVLASLAAPAEVMLAVKANAYGHGVIELSHAAIDAGARSLAVLDVSTAIAIREAGITVPLFAWLHGPHTDFAAAAEHEIDLGISSEWQIAAIRAAAPGGGTRVHLKIDTGLSRNGASAQDWPGLVKAALAAQHAGDVTIVAAWSHLADASVDEDALALSKLHEAVAVAKELGCEFANLHLAASSAGIREPEARLSFVRFGIAAYGISPFDDETGTQLGLTPVMTLESQVIAVEGTTATVSFGFGDGIHAPALPQAEVQSKNGRHKILQLDVDSMVIDVGANNLVPGDTITVFGTGLSGEPTAEEWALCASTIGDEIVSRVALRVPRVYINR